MATKKQFTSLDDAIANAPTPVLVDFYATWCGPRQMMAGILEQVGADLRGRLQILKIDSDRYPNLASTHHVQALPTLILFKNGQPVDRLEGVLPRDRLIAWIKPHL
ncbi:MAG: thioredoxin [Cyanobacteria bacterium]|nr:thioredoxin [Cyanobacteriota bacterium]